MFFKYLPEQASDFAHSVDWLNFFVGDLSVFFTVAIVGAMLWFAFRYRRRDGVDHETPHIEGSAVLETIWTVVPTIVCIFVAAYGVIVYKEMREAPGDAMDITVVGKQWLWEFEYKNGKKTTNELVVPVDRPIRLVMTSRDVLHSLFIPAMRIKKDVVPGTYMTQWFRAIKTGTYPIFCTEYCGTNHAAMLAQLRVLPEAEYERWLADDSEALRMARMKPSDVGKELFVKKGCNACHSLDGSRLVGPSFLKLMGRSEKMIDGTELTVEENYLKESILNPNAKIVETFAPNLMPAFAGQLSDDEVHGLIEFIKTIDGSQSAAPVAPAASAAKALSPEERAKLSPVERGKLLSQEKICATCHSLDGSKLVGPSWKGLYGRSGKLADGSSYTADDAYLKHSILKPAEQVVEGYAPSMPPYEGQLSDADIADIIEYIKTVK